MRIRMLITQRGADDGFTLRTYEAGTEHELGPEPRALDLAQAFIRQGWAVDAAAAPSAASPLLLLCECGNAPAGDSGLCESCEDKLTAPLEHVEPGDTENTLAPVGETAEPPKLSASEARKAAKAAQKGKA